MNKEPDGGCEDELDNDPDGLEDEGPGGLNDEGPGGLDRVSEQHDRDGRSLDEPDLDRWALILSVPEFRTSLRAFDEILEAHDYPVELHVARSSFKQVEYDHQPKPDRLTLVIANEYEEFMETVHHPVFHSMKPDDRRQPKDADIVLGFGGYDETRAIPAEFEYLTIHVPTFHSYRNRVIQAFAEQYSTE